MCQVVLFRDVGVGRVGERERDLVTERFEVRISTA